jgi:hypothetical protein
MIYYRVRILLNATGNASTVNAVTSVMLTFQYTLTIPHTLYVCTLLNTYTDFFIKRAPGWSLVPCTTAPTTPAGLKAAPLIACTNSDTECEHDLPGAVCNTELKQCVVLPAGQCYSYIAYHLHSSALYRVDSIHNFVRTHDPVSVHFDVSTAMLG